MSYDFYMPVRVIGGEKAIVNSADRLAALGKACLIVTGGSGALKSGALQDVVDALGSVGIKYEIFDKIEANPKASTCCAAGKIAREKGCDFIIGIGGGSALDASKAVAVFAADPGLDSENVYKMDFAYPPLPTVGVGTTSGTGSEISAVSVITDDGGTKRSIKGDFGYFDLVFADWRYTCSCSYAVTVSTALDAFMHAAEGVLGPRCNEPAYAFAAECLPKIWEELKKMKNTGECPDDEGRKALYHASLSAGFTLNYCGTLFPHPVGYILTEHYGIPHGRACAAFFEKLCAKAEIFAPERVGKLFGLFDDDKETVINTIKEMADCSGIVISKEKAAEHVKRWKTLPKNFMSTPGGYSPMEAADALEGLSR